MERIRRPLPPYVQLQDRKNWIAIHQNHDQRGGMSQQPTVLLRLALLYTIYLPDWSTTTPYGLYCLIGLLPCSTFVTIIADEIQVTNRAWKPKGWRCSLDRDENESMSGRASAAQQEAWTKIIKSEKVCASEHLPHSLLRLRDTISAELLEILALISQEVAVISLSKR